MAQKKATRKGAEMPAAANYAGTSDRVTSGRAFMVDDYAAQLEGEPPVAGSRGWGNLGWIFAPNLGGN
jgi:hypothetical protein